MKPTLREITVENFKIFLETGEGNSGSFFTALHKAIISADRENLAKLELGFPELVKAFREFSSLPKQEEITGGIICSYCKKPFTSGKIPIGKTAETEDPICSHCIHALASMDVALRSHNQRSKTDSGY